MKTSARPTITKGSIQSNMGLAAFGFMANKKLLSVRTRATISMKKPFRERIFPLVKKRQYHAWPADEGRIITYRPRFGGR